MFSLDKKVPRTFKFKSYNNAKLIEYATHMITYLRALVARGKPDIYWRFVLFLMRTSRVFQMMAIYKTFPRFHRDMSLSTIYALMEGVSSVIEKDA